MPQTATTIPQHLRNKIMDWDEYFFDIIKKIEKKSKDPSTRVGCVIVTPEHEIVTTGFNGFPRGVEDDVHGLNKEKVIKRYERPLKYLFTEHSERNAIYAAARRGCALDGCTIYVEWNPCADCMRAIIQSGIVEVVLNGRSESFNNQELYKRWADHIDASRTMAEEAGIRIRVWK